jgi:CHAD domain-containing protein
LRRSIRRCRRVLSEVRNCDVLLERAERTVKRKRVSRQEAWRAFRDYLKPRRARLFREASRRVSKLNLSTIYLNLRKELAALRSPSAWSELPAPAGHLPALAVDLDAVLRQRMAASLEKTWGDLLAAIAGAQESRAAGSLHSVRIAGKKVRYLIEVIHLLREPGSDAPLKHLRGMQALLGDWHDLEVLEQAMLEMVARSGMLSAQLELAMDVERVVIRSRKQKLACETKFYQRCRETGDWEQMGHWVKSFVASSKAPEVRKNAQSLRLLAEPNHLRPGNLSR